MERTVQLKGVTVTETQLKAALEELLKQPVYPTLSRVRRRFEGPHGTLGVVVRGYVAAQYAKALGWNGVVVVVASETSGWSYSSEADLVNDWELLP